MSVMTNNRISGSVPYFPNLVMRAREKIATEATCKSVKSNAGLINSR
jgi:hypothetical protein